MGPRRGARVTAALPAPSCVSSRWIDSGLRSRTGRGLQRWLRPCGRARGCKESIQTVPQGWQNFDFGTEKWDLIVLSYAWVPINDPAFVKRLLLEYAEQGALRLLASQ